MSVQASSRANVEFSLVVASGWRTLLAAAAGRSVRGAPCRGL